MQILKDIDKLAYNNGASLWEKSKTNYVKNLIAVFLMLCIGSYALG